MRWRAATWCRCRWPGEACAASSSRPRPRRSTRASLRASSDTWVSATGLPGTTARRRALLDLLADGPLPLAELVERAGTTAATVRRLAKDGLVSLDARLRVPRVTAGRTP